MADTDQTPTTISDIRNDDRSATKADLSSLPEVDPAYYTLGKEVGRGGMGRVMEARDLRVGRSVVLKELLDESPSHALRFEREARVTARLQHPAIVPIYEIGKWPDGAPFYAMRMVEGRNLRTAITEAKTLEERFALLPSVIVAAEAVAYAHAHRVIHRDLKPSNIMVGDFGETIVIDWGLAKDLGEPVPEERDEGPYRNNGDLTLVGAVVGTPAYMPPEQARGEAVDERGDVYSLGAILYHLLTGEAPFRGNTSEDLLESVKISAPPSIRRRAPAAPRDLLSIVDKAMRRDPASRYANATELVAELVRFRTGQLVGAHHYSRGELVRRWVRNHRFAALSALSALVALAIAGSVAVVGIMRERDRADLERSVAVAQREKADDRTLALYEEQGRQLFLQGQSDKALAYLDEAFLHGRDTPALRFLIAAGLQELAAQRSIDCGGVAQAFAESPDGSRLAVVCGGLAIFDLPMRTLVRAPAQEPVFELTYSHNGRLIAGSGHLIVWTSDGTKLFDLGHDRTGRVLGFTDDDRLVVTFGWDGTLETWETKTGARVRTIHVGREPLAGMLAAYSGDVAAIVSLYGNVDLWNVRSGERIGHAVETGRIAAVSTDRAGSVFATCGEEGASVRTRTGQLVRAFPPRHAVFFTCELSPDGSRLALGDMESTVEVVDLATGAVVADLFDPTISPAWAKFSGDGRFVAGASIGGISVFDAQTGAIVQRTSSVMFDKSFALNGDLLIATSLGDLVVTKVVPPLKSFDSPKAERVIATSDDGTRAATRRDDGTVTIWNVDTGQPIAHAGIRQHTRQSGDGFSYAEPDPGFSAGGRLVAVVSAHDLAVLDGTTGAVVASLPMPSQPPELEFDQAAHRLRVGSPSPAVWDVQTQQDLLHRTDVDDVAALSFDGRYALLRVRSSLEVFDLDRHVTVSKLDMTFVENPDVTATTLGVGFSSDASRIVVNVQSGENGHSLVGIFDCVSGKRLAEFPASSYALSRSHELLAYEVGGRGGTVEIRSVRDGRVLSSAPNLAIGYAVNAGAPSDDGHFLLQYSNAHTERDLVDAATGHILAHYGRRRSRQKILAPGFEEVDPDAKWLASGDGFVSASGGVVVWPFRLENRSPRAVDESVRAVTPWRLVNGALVPAFRRLRGVVSAHGAPVGGATIRVADLLYQLPFTTTTDTHGLYELELPDGEYTLSAEKGPAKSPVVLFAITFRSDRTHDLELK